MTEKSTDITEKMDNRAIIEYLSDTFPEEERKAITRDLFIVSQIKTISMRVEEESVDAYGNKKTKWVNMRRKMTIYESLAHVMLCRSLNFNPALNLVTMLEESFYIGLEGHKAYAQSTGLCRGWEVVLVKSEPFEYQKKEWVKKGEPEKLTKVNGMRYEYKCTVKKIMPDGEIVEYYGKGIADPSNVAGGEKMTDLKIEQMAEARATRRALGNAFPPGVGHIEDVTEAPDYYLPERTTQAMLPEDTDKFKRSELIASSEPETLLAKEEAPTAPAPKKPTAKAPVKTPTPMPIPSNSTELPTMEITQEELDAMDDGEYSIRHDNGEIPPRTLTPEAIPTPVPESVAKKDTPIDSEENYPIGIDQLNRIAELCKQLGYSDMVTDDAIAKLNNRSDAQKAISTLVGKVAAKAGQPKTSSVKKMGEKVEEEYAGIKADPRFKQMCGEDEGMEEMTLDETNEIFGEENTSTGPKDSEKINTGFNPVADKNGAMEYLEGLSEGKLRNLLLFYREQFKYSLTMFKQDSSEENSISKTIHSAWCAAINQTIIKNGYGVK